MDPGRDCEPPTDESTEAVVESCLRRSKEETLGLGWATATLLLERGVCREDVGVSVGSHASKRDASTWVLPWGEPAAVDNTMPVAKSRRWY